MEEAVQVKQERKEAKRKLSLERNRTAFERLHLAWSRSSLTLIAIAIGIYEFYHNRVETGKRPLMNFISGRDFALVLLSGALVMLLLATLQHRARMNSLKKQYPDMQYSVSLGFSYFILTLGTLLLSVVLFIG